MTTKVERVLHQEEARMISLVLMEVATYPLEEALALLLWVPT
jgi:hypothetical protein